MGKALFTYGLPPIFQDRYMCYEAKKFGGDYKFIEGELFT